MSRLCLAALTVTLSICSRNCFGTIAMLELILDINVTTDRLQTEVGKSCQESADIASLATRHGLTAKVATTSGTVTAIQVV